MAVKRAKNIIIVELNAEIDSGWKDGTLIVSLKDDKFYRMDSGSAVEISAGGAGGGVSGGSGVIQGKANWVHTGTAASSTIGTGFANDGSGHVDGTSAGFDNSNLGGSYIGLSINGGTSAAWTVTQVIAEAQW